MDKRSANGYPKAAGESGGSGQRKQLPYSVETPYGFHLDLDFLKYVDDIEKGNTIKRVHIQRKARGPPKFSTLPRNFCLPGHAARPVPKDTWSATSTLGPKPRGRVNEVQQIFDFRPSDRDTAQSQCQSGKSQGGSLASRPMEVAGAGARVSGQQPPERPNLLRTSSMPVTIPHRKGSESGDEKTDGGSSENVFRSVPQDRLGLHQQITAALKRVRELEDMVRTIPELKSQICSLREEREQLILRLQAQTKPQPPPPPQRTSPSPAPRTHAGLTSQSQESGAAVEPGRTKRTSSETATQQQKSVKSTAPDKEPDKLLIAQEPKKQTGTSTKPDRQAETSVAPEGQKVLVYPLDHISKRQAAPSDNVAIQKAEDSSETKGAVPVIDGVSVTGEGDLLSVEQLQARLVALEAKLSEASDNLERTNGLLRQQVEQNRMKEEMIVQLSESGLEGAELSEDRGTRRRTSVDQQTETERAGMVEQGTETESIIICLTRETRSSRVNHMTETERFDAQERDGETEMVVVCPARPRANSVDRGTETERVDTVDRVTETPPEARLDQVMEMPMVVSVDRTTATSPVRPARPARHRANNTTQATEMPVGDGVGQLVETPTVPVRPARPARQRTGSVDRGTETERVGTVDQVTETVAAQRTDQQTETDRDRAENSNNPCRAIEIESAAIVSAAIVSAAIESAVTEIAGEDSVVIGSTAPESLVTENADNFFRDYEITESVETEEGFVVIHSVSTGLLKTENVITKSVVTDNVVTESVVTDSVVTDNVVTESVVIESVVTDSVVTDSVVSENVVTNSVVKESVVTESVVTDNVVTESVVTESVITKTQVVVDDQAVLEQIRANKNDTTKTTSADNTVTESVITETVVTDNVVTDNVVTDNVVTDSVVTEIVVTESVITENVANVTEVPKTSDPGSPVAVVPIKVVAKIETPRAVSPVPTPSTSQTRIGQKDNEQSQSQECRLPKPAQDQGPRRGSNPALGQVVTRLTGLINEQWAQLGSSQDKQESPSASTQKTAGGQGKVTSGKPSAGKPSGGKPGTSKMSSIQNQLVSSLSALSAFYSPGQKAAASKQQGLKSIMKKKDATDKQGSKGGAKKNLKFVGVNGGYETTSSEESSGEEKDEPEEVDSSEPEELHEDQHEELGECLEQENQGEATVTEEEAQVTGVQGEEVECQLDTHIAETSQALLEEQPARGEMIDKDFMEACYYIKDRMSEVETPDTEMRHALTVLYQEWFRVSSQKDSLTDTVTLYLREVGLATPTLLRFIVNLADANGNTALHYSVSHSNFAVVKLLLDTGLCEADIQNKAGYTAVMLASLTAADRSEDMEVALQLLRQGDVNARASQAGQTSLMLSVSHGRTAMVRLLLSCQADVNIQDVDGSSALMCACEHGHIEIARTLLESGVCDAGLTDRKGQSALSLAIAGSHAELVDLLKTHSYSSTPSATIITTTTASLL
ncbi:hypothetical protein DPEC_G00338360 [Dallia pectoralis]|uniref:Uncharacterized protein n=1 Tax=Dallia pectoralis TaxID=75939 RepID=A0ACC2F4K4_DALPE|nr:hypothetical protein DPEC_G00338360 [Dallia pectoralis]